MTRAPRALHLGKFYPPFAGGIENFMADLLPAQRVQGIAVAALVHNHRSGLFGERPPASGAALPLYRAPCFGRLLYAPISPAFPLWLNRAIGECRPDLLHIHMPNTSAFWALGSAPAKRLPWVIHWHSDVVATRLDRRLALAYALYRPLEQRLLARAAAIVATSPDYLTASSALRPWREKCRVIPLGLAPERFASPEPAALARARGYWRAGSYRALAVGRLTHYKGFDVLIRALARSNRDIELVIVGTGERSYRARLQALSGSLGLRPRVRLLGALPAPALHAALAACDVVCLPSVERSEAFGLVLLEAMRFARPVIASDIPGSGVGWVVRRGNHGLLVAPNDPGALALALDTLATTPSLGQDYGRRGAAALTTRFGIKPIAAQVLALYRELVSARINSRTRAEPASRDKTPITAPYVKKDD